MCPCCRCWQLKSPEAVSAAEGAWQRSKRRMRHASTHAPSRACGCSVQQKVLLHGEAACRRCRQGGSSLAARGVAWCFPCTGKRVGAAAWPSAGASPIASGCTHARARREREGGRGVRGAEGWGGFCPSPVAWLISILASCTCRHMRRQTNLVIPHRCVHRAPEGQEGLACLQACRSQLTQMGLIIII